MTREGDRAAHAAHARLRAQQAELRARARHQAGQELGGDMIAGYNRPSFDRRRRQIDQGNNDNVQTGLTRNSSEVVFGLVAVGLAATLISGERATDQAPAQPPLRDKLGEVATTANIPQKPEFFVSLGAPRGPQPTRVWPGR